MTCPEKSLCAEYSRMLKEKDPSMYQSKIQNLCNGNGVNPEDGTVCVYKAYPEHVKQ